METRTRLTELIKSLDHQFMVGFRDHGRIRVGTLQAYQKIEGVRQDQLEGVKHLSGVPGHVITITPEQLKRLLPGNVRITGGKGMLLFPGANVSIGTVVPDAYVFCVAEVYHPKFGNSHYGIHKPVEFGAMLKSKLREIDEQITVGFLTRVKYGGYKDIKLDHPDDVGKFLEASNAGEVTLADYRTKPTAYSDEREWRLVFLTNKTDLPSYVDIECDVREIRQYCRFP
jgi:hypothetical protein